MHLNKSVSIRKMKIKSVLFFLPFSHEYRVYTIMYLLGVAPFFSFWLYNALLSSLLFIGLLVDDSGMLALYRHHGNGHSFYQENFILSDLRSFVDCVLRIWELIEEVEEQHNRGGILQGINTLTVDDPGDTRASDILETIT